MTNLSKHGFWIFVDDRERFVPFADFPWFKKASIDEILNVEQPGPNHLHWPDLDVDLAVASLEHPEAFPLISRLGRGESTKAKRPSARRTTTRKKARSKRT